MLKLYHSNRLETLFDSLTTVVNSPSDISLSPEIIIVQSQGMARWLSLELAKRLGICANIEFPFPASFIWRLFKAMDKPSEGMTTYEVNALVWAVMKQLDTLLTDPAFSEVSNYLATDLPGRRYQLAYRIAVTFDQYMAYRPDWIKEWDAGKAHHWQAELWRRLQSVYGDCHRAALLFELLETLDKSIIKRAGIPDRICLFGIPALPLTQHEVFSRLAEYIDVHLFLLNPCRVYWDEIVSKSDQAGISLRNISQLDIEADLYFDSGNSLLASFGKLGRDFQRILHNYDYEEIRHFDDPGQTTMLTAIQSDILHAYDRGPDDKKSIIRPDDESIQVHAAHSPMREVEILYDRLLDMFDSNSRPDKADLQPCDVLVMATDISLYTPFIEAVFAYPEDEKLHIPFSIADRSIGKNSAVIKTFLYLLKVAGGRLTSTELLSLLDCEPIRDRFKMSRDDIKTISIWVRDTAIHWGIDKSHRERMGLPASQRGTWRDGINRLLLGYALPGRRKKFFKDILPYDCVEGSGGELLGIFIGFCNEFFAFVSDISRPRGLPEWSIALLKTVEKFFESSDPYEADIELLRNMLDDLGRSAKTVEYNDPVSIDVVAAHLETTLKHKTQAGNFLSGQVTFCQMAPMRSIPFKVICLLGMDDNAFPRINRSPGFDLMANNHRIGDRLRRDDDRYLFLETLLSARDCLYISYVGRGIRDNCSRPPSPVVDELMDYIRQACHLDRDEAYERLVTFHPLQPFSRKYFAGNQRLFSYSHCNRIIAGADQQSRIYSGIFSDRLPEVGPETIAIEVNDFIRFFSNPTRYLLQERFGLLLDDDHDETADRELFCLNQLEKYQLTTELIEEELAGEDSGSLFPVYQAMGDIPEGIYGMLTYRQHVDVAQTFSANLHELRGSISPTSLDIDMRLGRVHLVGRLEIWPKGQYLFRPTRCGHQNFRDTIRHWILHLLFNAAGSEKQVKRTFFVGNDGSIRYDPLEDAVKQLNVLADLYLHGLSSPLPLFPQASYRYALQLWGKKGTPLEQALRIATQVWHEGYFSAGIPRPAEKRNPYFRVAFGEVDPLQNTLFHEAAEAVLQSAIEKRKMD